MKIPLAWVAQLLGISPSKARRLVKCEANQVDTEDFTEYVEKTFKNKKARYNELIESINKIEMKGGD